jgi:hypothetical protein
MGKQKIDPKHHPAIVAAYTQGSSAKEIGLDHGVVGETVMKIIRKAGVPARIGSSYRKLPVNEAYFSSIDCEAKSYWLGVLMADGCVHDTKVMLGFKASDLEHLLAFRLAIGSAHAIGRHAKGLRTLSVRSPSMVADLLSLGVRERKTGQERTPPLSSSLLGHFYRGYFDGDGCIYRRTIKSCHKMQWSLSVRCASSVMIDEFRDWVSGQTGGRKGCKTYSAKQHCYNLCFGGNLQAASVARSLYDGCTIALQRKRERYEQLTLQVPP